VFRNICLLFIVLFVFSLSSYSQSVNEIIEANLKASGTREKMASVKSWEVVLQEKNVADNNVPVTTMLSYKAPDKFKTDITYQGKKIIFGTDGNDFWGKNEMAGKTKFEKIPDANKAKAKEQMMATIDMLWPATYAFKKDSIISELIGVVDVDGKKCNKIKAIDPKTKTDRVLYIDAITNLLYKVEGEVANQNKTNKYEQVFAEYQKSDGIFVPKKIVVKVDGILQSESIYQTITINKNIPDEDFKIPENKESSK
jgi:outer membrane lipoprotein-sorting protein